MLSPIRSALRHTVIHRLFIPLAAGALLLAAFIFVAVRPVYAASLNLKLTHTVENYSVEPGDDVVVNTTAVGLGLGTGGWHFVHWNLAVDRWDEPGPGHIMKLRYSSLQVDTGAAEEHHPEPLQQLARR